MIYIPKRVQYGDFPSEGIYGITANRALELVIDGSLTAYHLLPTDVTVYEYQYDDHYVGTSLGKWHGLTVKVPRGIAYHLSFNPIHQILDHEGKSTALPVDGPLGTPDMKPEIPEKDVYLLWPEGDSFLSFERGQTFFLREDLMRAAESCQTAPPLLNASDAALGASIRERNQKFADKQQERHGVREIEHQRWRDAAAQIQQSRERVAASKRQLAELVKAQLNLPDSVETIRKVI